MIRITDATLLALTKLRARKVRTGITIFVSALLFGVLIAALVTANGAFRSVEDFSQEGLNDRFLVHGVPGRLGFSLLDNKKLIAQAKQLFEQRIDAKISEAERLGISYNSTVEQSPVRSYDDKPEHERLIPYHPITDQVILDYYTVHPLPDISDLQKTAAPYHSSDSFVSYIASPKDGAIVDMVNGKEIFDTSAQSGAPNSARKPIFGNDRLFSLTAPELSRPFLLPNADWSSDSDNIPLIVPQGAAEQLLGLTPLETDATPTIQLQRIEYIYRHAANKTFTACYRNTVSQQQIKAAVQAKKSGDATKYQPPIIYGLPAADSCGPATVINDTRTEAQKLHDDKQAQFDKKFGATVKPHQQKLTFQIVGVSPDRQRPSTINSAGALVRSLTRGATVGLAIPMGMYEQLPADKQYKNIFNTKDDALFGGLNVGNTVEFTSATDAKRFIDEQSCHNGPSGKCEPSSKPFQLYSFGGNTLALADLKDKFAGIFKIAALVVIGLAAIIMSATIGRMIADGRRETAVFRAIGFKRGDIAAVYIIYTLLLAGLVALLALAIGIAAAYGLDLYFWQELTVQAKLAFGAMDASREFHLFAIDTSEIWLVVAAVFVAGLLSIILPLLRNIRRNPIKDMRDE